MEESEKNLGASSCNIPCETNIGLHKRSFLPGVMLSLQAADAAREF